MQPYPGAALLYLSVAILDIMYVDLQHLRGAALPVANLIGLLAARLPRVPFHVAKHGMVYLYGII